MAPRKVITLFTVLVHSLAFISLVMVIIATASAAWIRDDGFQNEYGLWRTCNFVKDTCQSFPTRDVPDFLHAIRAFLLMTILTLSGLVVYMFVMYKAGFRHPILIMRVLIAIAFFLLMVALLIYLIKGGYRLGRDFVPIFHWGFAIACSALVVITLCGLFSYFDRHDIDPIRMHLMN